MDIYTLTLTAANQFTGVDAATGLLSFRALYDFAALPDRNRGVLLYGYAYDGGAFTADITVVLRDPGGVATSRVVLHQEVGRTSLFRSCGRDGMVVPLMPAGPWDLAVITANKVADASFEAWFGITLIP